MDYQLFQNLRPFLVRSRVMDRCYGIHAEAAAAEFAVDVVVEHVALAAEGHQLPDRRAPGGFHHDDIGAQFTQVTAAKHGVDLQAAVAAFEDPDLAQGFGFGHLMLGMEPALEDGGDFPGRLGADLGIIYFFKSGNWG
jgi:hypothetical protein